MRCPKCNSLIADDINFCNYCGEPVKPINQPNTNNNHDSQYNYSTNYSDVNTTSQNQDHNNHYNYSSTYSNVNSTNQNQNHNDHYNYSSNYSNIDTTQISSEDEELLKAYVGNNYESLKKNDFNLFAFFFNGYYYLYRKMYKLFFIYLGIGFLSVIFGGLGSILSFGFNIYIAIKFNELYIKNAREEIQKIKQSNQNKTNSEIIELCRKKGNTNILAPILIAVFTFILVFLIVAIVVFAVIESDLSTPFNDDYNNSNYNYEKTETNDSFGDLHYNIPTGFQDSINSESSKTYTYLDNKTYESFSIIINSFDNYSKIDSKELLKKFNYKDDYILTKNINNTEWSYFENPTYKTYYYCADYNGKIYLIHFMLISDKGNFEKIKNEFLSTLKFSSTNETTNKPSNNSSINPTV